MAQRPQQKSSDAEKFRQEYLAMLDLQAANNEKNLQQNLLHKRTGQIASQITDYRTPTQKLADVTALRIELRKELRRICDVANAEQTVNALNDDEFRYAVQSIDEIVQRLKPRFRYGVLAPYLINYIQQSA